MFERNSEQGVSKDNSSDTSKDTTTKVEKAVDADATASDEQLKPSTGTKEVVGESEAKPVAVKTTRKSANKG